MPFNDFSVYQKWSPVLHIKAFSSDLSSFLISSAEKYAKTMPTGLSLSTKKDRRRKGGIFGRLLIKMFYSTEKGVRADSRTPGSRTSTRISSE
jgi:hypothetical protein